MGRAQHFHRTIFRAAAGLGAACRRDIRDVVLALSNRQLGIGYGLVGSTPAVRRRNRPNRRMAVAHRLRPPEYRRARVLRAIRWCECRGSRRSNFLTKTGHGLIAALM